MPGSCGRLRSGEGRALPGEAEGGNSERAAGFWLFYLDRRAMAEEELEALRKQRLAELQAKQGVSALAARPAQPPAWRRPRPRWRAQPQAEALDATAGVGPAGGEPRRCLGVRPGPFSVWSRVGFRAACRPRAVPCGSSWSPLSGTVRLAPEVAPGLASVQSRSFSLF